MGANAQTPEKIEKDFTPRHLDIKTNKNSNFEKFHEAGYPNKDISLYLKEVMIDGQQIWDSISSGKAIPPTIFHSPRNSNEMVRSSGDYPNIDIVYIKEDGNWKPKFIQNKIGERLPYGDNTKITKDFQYPDTKQE
jgi:hypothetical protein